MEWSYKILSVDKFVSLDSSLTVEEQLNKLGNEGWELACVLDKTTSSPGRQSKLDSDYIVFKRTISA